MKNSIFMIKHNLKIMVLKKPLFFILSVLLPIIGVYFVSNILSSNSGFLTFGYTDNNSTFSSELLRNKIEADDSIKLVKYSEEDLKKEVKLGNIQGGLVIKENFEKDILKGKLNLEIIKLEGKKSILESIVNEEGNNLIRLGKIANGDLIKYVKLLEEYEDKNINIERKGLGKNIKDSFSNIAIVGFSIMALLFRGNMGASRVNKDKEDKVYERMFAGGLKAYQYYIGNIGGSLVAIMLQVVAMVLILGMVKSLDVGLTSIQLLVIFALAGVLGVSLGSFNVSMTKNAQESSMLSNVIMMILLMLGGCFVPIYLFPSFLEKISWFLPTRWLMDMVNGLGDGGRILDYSLNIFIVLLFSVVLFLIVAYKVKMEEKINRN